MSLLELEFLWVPYDSCDGMTFCQGLLNQMNSGSS